MLELYFRHPFKLAMTHGCKTCRLLHNCPQTSVAKQVVVTFFSGLCNWVMWSLCKQVHLWGGSSLRAVGVRHAEEDEGDHWLAGRSRWWHILSG